MICDICNKHLVNTTTCKVEYEQVDTGESLTIYRDLCLGCVFKLGQLMTPVFEFLKVQR